MPPVSGHRILNLTTILVRSWGIGLLDRFPLGEPSQDTFARRVMKGLRSAQPHAEVRYDKEQFGLLIVEGREPAEAEVFQFMRRLRSKADPLGGGWHRHICARVASLTLAEPQRPTGHGTSDSRRCGVADADEEIEMNAAGLIAFRVAQA